MPVETQRSSDVQVLSFEVLRRFTLEHLLTRFLYATAFQELASQYTWYRKEEKEKEKKNKTTFDSILDQSGIKQTSQKIFREIAKNSSLLCIYVCIYLLGVHVSVSYCSIHRSHFGTLFILACCNMGNGLVSGVRFIAMRHVKIQLRFIRNVQNQFFFIT